MLHGAQYFVSLPVVDAAEQDNMQGTNESYKLLPDPDAASVDRVAALLGLRKVGWVFTAR